ncbi:hypothetical protein L1887_50677 [Cichorium endivia]|nr:hypothetical protein L1887_50677 [Cichorium endivia]
MRPTCGSVADPWEAHIFRPTSATRSTVFSRPTDVLAGNTLQHDGPSYPFIPLLHFKKYCKTKREWNLCGGFSRQADSGDALATVCTNPFTKRESPGIVTRSPRLAFSDRSEHECKIPCD